MDVASAIATVAIDSTVKTVARKLDYLLHYKRIIHKLEKEVEKLRDKSMVVRDEVNSALANGEVIENVVENWLNMAHTITEGAAPLIVEGHHSSPNLKSRYKLGRKAAKMIKDINRLLMEDMFERASSRVSVHLPIWEAEPTITDYRVFESRESICNEVMKTLRDPGIHMIGVYGPAGVGKTTLANEIARKAQEDELFDVVIMASVTGEPDPVEVIQRKIGEMLGLEFEEGGFERANQISERLKQEKTAFVILDDLRAGLDLCGVGIPFGVDHKGCKILLTSRSLQILNEQMGTQKTLQVSVLDMEKSWELFKYIIGIDNSDESIDFLPNKEVAKEVASQCHGLPIALVTVARALRNASSDEWNAALKQLSSLAAGDIEHSSIELSYDNIKNEESKFIFLFCALMGCHIVESDILKCCVGLDLFKDISTIEEARHTLNKLIRELKAAYLLQDHSSNKLTMHDVVRDVAISIASKQNQVVIGRHGTSHEWPGKDQLEKCTAISLAISHKGQLPDCLNCPILNFLHIGCKERRLKIPDGLFKGMSELRVLSLENMECSCLPYSITLLRNLQTLRLDNCRLDDIAFIGELKNLKVLSLVASDIKKLPQEIGGLERLQLLDLSYCSKLEVIPPNVISNLKELEELQVEESYNQWKDEGSNSENASLTELRGLTRLTSLAVYVPSTPVLPRNLFSELKLERFRILIGDGWNRAGEYESSRTLKLKLIDRSLFLWDDGVISLLAKAEDLYLDKMIGVYVLEDLNVKAFPCLKNLHVQNNEIKCIFHDPAHFNDHSFHQLESLFLHNLKNLEKICHGQLSVPPFSKLRVLKVSSCHGLYYLLSIFIIKHLSQLIEVEVYDCDSLEELFVPAGDEDCDYNMQSGNLHFFQLKALTLQNLPALTRFSSQHVGDKVQNLSAAKVEDSQDTGSFSQQRDGRLFNSGWMQRFAKLKKLIIGDCKSLEVVFDLENSELDGNAVSSSFFSELKEIEICSLPYLKLLWGNVPPNVEGFHNLTSLKVERCDNLIYAFPAAIAVALTQLQKLVISSCQFMQDVIGSELDVEVDNEIKEEESRVFGKVHTLILEDLPCLESIGPNTFESNWQSLTYVCICGCPKLKETSHPMPKQAVRYEVITNDPQDSTLPAATNMTSNNEPTPSEGSLEELIDSKNHEKSDQPYSLIHCGERQRPMITTSTFPMSQGESVQEVGESSGIHKILHEDLPLILHCFLFPRGYEFTKEELVTLWIAEEVFLSNQNQIVKVEDIANDKFNSLVSEKIIVQSRTDSSLERRNRKEVGKYKLNESKVSSFEAAASDYGYFKACDGRFKNVSERVLHLSMLCKNVDDKTFQTIKKFKDLRTLFMVPDFGPSIERVPRDLFLSLKQLRTMNFSRSRMSELPSSIGNLKALKYIDLSFTPIKQLPDSIDTLQNLQTLKLRGCSNLVALPNGMSKLTNLRHLDLDVMGQLRSMPPKMGNLTKLQTLPAFLVDTDDGRKIGELKNVTNLKGEFCISRLENVSNLEEAKEANLINKEFLNMLELRWWKWYDKRVNDNSSEEEKILEHLQPPLGLEELNIVNYGGSKLPTWISDHSYNRLVEITLYNCRSCQVLPAMGELPSLQFLHIKEMNELRIIDDQFYRYGSDGDQQDHHAFPSLKTLTIDAMPELEVWIGVQSGDFPCLHELQVKYCPKLNSLPSLSCIFNSLKHLEMSYCQKIQSFIQGEEKVSLEFLLIRDCPILKERCKQEEGPDWNKIEHVPNILIDDEEI